MIVSSSIQAQSRYPLLVATTYSARSRQITNLWKRCVRLHRIFIERPTGVMTQQTSRIRTCDQWSIKVFTRGSQETMYALQFKNVSKSGYVAVFRIIENRLTITLDHRPLTDRGKQTGRRNQEGPRRTDNQTGSQSGHRLPLVHSTILARCVSVAALLARWQSSRVPSYNPVKADT